MRNMNNLSLLLNNICAFGYSFDYHRFMDNLDDARGIQEQILLRIIHKNRNTQFGKQFRFKSIRSVKDFQAIIPIMTYEDYLPWINQIIEGQRNVLTSERVHLLEPTGGSSGGSKLIPYTASFKKEFQQAVGTWLFDLFQQFPEIKHGKSYWSISPINFERKKTVGGIPIGFEDDTDYLGWFGSLMAHTLAVPQQIKKVKNIENFRYLTSYFLLLAEDLSFISVWNPTFLMLIIENMELSIASLIKDIFDGKISLPFEENIGYLEKFIKASPRRARALEKIFSSKENINYSKVWTNLKLISCWMDGPSKFYAQKLIEKFLHVVVQGKGLIATEGIVSIPLSSIRWHVPAYHSHFLEFQKEGEKLAQLIDELEENEVYQITITTGGGFYRYNLQDKVQVIGKFKGLPILEFLGRDKASDLVGEKLNDAHVSKVIQNALNHYKIECNFVMLAPQQEDTGAYYVLFIESKNSLDPEILSKITQLIDQGLKENFHYKYACDLKQILPLRVFIVKEDAHKIYINRCLSEGQKFGDIKHAYLDRRSDWSNYFDGEQLFPSSIILKGPCEDGEDRGSGEAHVVSDLKF